VAHAALGARLAGAAGDRGQRITLIHERSLDGDLAIALQHHGPVAFPALADSDAHAITLIAADLRLVGRVEDAVGKYQQVADGIAFGSKIHRGLAHRPFDHFDLLGGHRRYTQQRCGERRHAAHCEFHGVPFKSVEKLQFSRRHCASS
jgi:hypothetical protein